MASSKGSLTGNTTPIPKGGSGKLTGNLVPIPKGRGRRPQGAYPPTKLPGSPPRNGGIPGYQPGMIRPPTKPPGGIGNLTPIPKGQNPGGRVTNPLVPGRLNPELLRRMAARRLGG